LKSWTALHATLPKVGQGDGKAVGKAKRNKKMRRWAYLLKPSPIIVAGLTLCVADAKATAVARGCCFSLPAERQNQTILGDSLGRQGGRPLFRDGYATVSFLMRRGRNAYARAKKPMAEISVAERRQCPSKPCVG
jgi:hypothetical protein